ncbi:MAG: chorismate mutase [Chloroflexota bacterium]
MPVRGIRGATTAEVNSRQAILDATKELLQRIIAENGLQLDDVASAFFTTTSDLDATFPALAARQLGWDTVPLIDARELDVPGSLRLCLRVLLLVNTERSQRDIQHVYLRGASGLRDDVSRRLG